MTIMLAILDGAPIPPLPPDSIQGQLDQLFAVFILVFLGVLCIALAYVASQDNQKEQLFQHLLEQAKRDRELQQLIDVSGRKPWQPTLLEQAEAAGETPTYKQKEQQ